MIKRLEHHDRGIESELTEMRARAKKFTASIQNLRTEEAELVGALSLEQSRWNDVNQRLEDLERLLTR